MRSSLIFAALVAAVSAQSANFTSCCGIEPNTVDVNERLSWCRAQQNTCPLLCTNGQTSKNDCDSVSFSSHWISFNVREAMSQLSSAPSCGSSPGSQKLPWISTMEFCLLGN
jgi:hypothetical protein